jgi:hypothetical protein
MRVLPFLLLVSLAGSVGSPAETAIRPDRTIHLFDGKSLAPFYTWLVDDHRQDPLRVFSVVDQVDGAPAIRVSGERWGGLVTRDSYRDYRLVVEFRWGLATWGERRNAARDSGILIHAQGADGNTGADFNGPWMRSIEAQVIEGGVGDIILVGGFDDRGPRVGPHLAARAGKDRYGRDVDWRDELGFRGRQDVESPYGQWTRLEVVADGDRVTNVVDGKVVNEGRRSTFTEGRIIVQSEGAEIYFRRLDLEPLK